MSDRVENGGDSRGQIAYCKRKKVKDMKYKIPMKMVEPTTETKVYKYREPGNVADHEFTKKYGVSYHAAHRMLQRIFKQEAKATEEDLEKAAIMIWKNIPEARELGEGQYPLMGGFLAIVRNSVVVTILEKKD